MEWCGQPDIIKIGHSAKTSVSLSICIQYRRLKVQCMARCSQPDIINIVNRIKTTVIRYMLPILECNYCDLHNVAIVIS